MSQQDHTTAQDGQSLLTQDPATQALFYDTWSIWAQVAWVLEHDYQLGLSHEPRPAVDVQLARSGNLPGNIPCSAGNQCASGVCAPEAGYRCTTALVDKSKINPLLQNPQQPNVTQSSGGTTGQGQSGTTTNRGLVPAGGGQTDVWQQLQAWFNKHDFFGPTGPSNGTVALIGGGALLLLSGGHHRRGGLF